MSSYIMAFIPALPAGDPCGFRSKLPQWIHGKSSSLPITVRFSSLQHYVKKKSPLSHRLSGICPFPWGITISYLKCFFPRKGSERCTYIDTRITELCIKSIMEEYASIFVCVLLCQSSRVSLAFGNWWHDSKHDRSVNSKGIESALS